MSQHQCTAGATGAGYCVKEEGMSTLQSGRLAHLLQIPPPAGEPRMHAAAGTDRERYRMHKVNAKRRGIPFLFTFEQWIEWWRATGHYHEYGNRRGQYVMARKGDIGPYSPENVECMQAQENSALPHRGVKRSEETRLRMSNAVRKSWKEKRK